MAVVCRKDCGKGVKRVIAINDKLVKRILHNNIDISANGCKKPGRFGDWEEPVGVGAYVIDGLRETKRRASRVAGEVQYDVGTERGFGVWYWREGQDNW